MAADSLGFSVVDLLMLQLALCRRFPSIWGTDMETDMVNPYHIGVHC